MNELLAGLLNVLMPAGAQAADAPIPEPDAPTQQPRNFSSAGSLGWRPPAGTVLGEPQSPPVADAIKKLFMSERPATTLPQSPPQIPTPSGIPAPVALAGRIGPQAAAAIQQEPIKDPNATTGSDVQRFIRSLAAGAAKVNPSSPGISAFAQGASGALQTRYGEEQRDKELESKRASEAYKRQIDANKERRAENADRRATTKDARDARAQDYLNAERVNKLIRAIDPQVDIKDRIALERLIRDKADSLRRQAKDLDITKEEAHKQLEQYTKRVEREFKLKSPLAETGATPVAPVAPSAGTQPAAPVKPSLPPAAGQIVDYGGQKYKFKGGNPADPASYEKVQ